MNRLAWLAIIFFSTMMLLAHAQKSEYDQLEELIFDVGDDFFEDDGSGQENNTSEQERAAEPKAGDQTIVNRVEDESLTSQNGFNVGKEEQELLSYLDSIGHKLSHDEWNEVIQVTNRGSYTVMDW